MNRKEKILAYMSSKEYIPLKLTELITVLDVPDADRQELEDVLNELLNEGKIFISKKGRYSVVGEGNNLFTGTLRCSARGFFGFAVSDDAAQEDVYIAGENMSEALNGDRVLVSVNKKRRGVSHNEGHVVKILERANKIITGVIYMEKHGYLCVRPDNRSIFHKIYASDSSSLGAKFGDRVVVSSIKYDKGGTIKGEITEILGEETSLKSLIEGIIIEHGIKRDFDQETLNEALHTPSRVTSDMLSDREDLRDMLIFTIDGEDAKDFDDAVSLDKTEDGQYLLGVHIADVSEYVKENSPLDNEAFERGKSVYLADRVIPMLPEKLSNGICSLNPNTNRLALSLFMEIDKTGSILSHRLSKTVICSKERMTYSNVNKILEENDTALCKRYEYMLETLRDMEILSSILRDRRTKRGAIQFDFPESRIIVNKKGEPTDIQPEIRGVSNKMIEEFILAANETIAEYAFWSEIPFVFRNHEPPSLEKIKAFNQFILRFGLQIKGKIDEDNPVKPKMLQHILDKVKDTPEERIVSSNMLQSLMKAKYSAENAGHFGLAAKYYCHFTSPIRRYPDLVVHRVLKKLIDGTLADGKNAYLQSFAASAAYRSSECEINAEYAERDVDDLMKAAYMSRFVGDSFDAVIANITSFGIFAELENSVEGLIRFESMTDDYYEFDENSFTLTGKRTGKTYSSGDNIRVIVAKTDIFARQIEFVFEDNADYMKKSKKTQEKIEGVNYEKD